MDKQRLEATHFIEVRNLEYIDAGNYGPVFPMDRLKFILQYSKLCMINTIAIWKIKFKQQN